MDGIKKHLELLNESTIQLYHNISSSIISEHVVENVNALVTSNAEIMTAVIDDIQRNIANVLDDNNCSVVDNDDTQSMTTLTEKCIRP